MPSHRHRTPPCPTYDQPLALRRPGLTSQDPAAEQFKYQVSLDVRDLVSLEVRRYALAPRASDLIIQGARCSPAFTSHPPLQVPAFRLPSARLLPPLVGSGVLAS
jgi:hypothetical protein